MLGETVSHYRVLERLGSGGMGDVYLAEDLRLGRKVALKLLGPHLTRDVAAKTRFLHEARAASLLDHPHICPVFDIEELPSGELCLAMAYCEGETLKSRLSKGPLSIMEAIDLASQVAEALAEAHMRGIVHRDVKPANVMVTKSGRARLLDFGIARLPEATMLTATGAVVGTPAYMAPEQARGEDADARADLWALGTMLYEMIAGRPPFGGENMQAILYGVLHLAPEPVDRLRPGVPAALATIVNRALAKDRMARYQHAEQMLADLRGCKAKMDAEGTGVAAGAGARIPSIAVLPFANMSAESGQDYFCEGMTEELITTLGAVEGLRVAAKTSTFHVHREGLEVREIGQRLNVATLLEGSVRRSGDRLRITAQLVNVADGYHLWSERYDRRLDDVFAVQEEIARAIVGRLRVRLIGGPDEAIVRRTRTDLEAYHLHMKGRFHFARRYHGGLEQAAECFARALELDPQYPSALAGLAECLCLEGFYGVAPPRRLLDKARQAAECAVALDGGLAEAHHALGMVHLWLDWNWGVIERAFVRSLELDPNAPLTHGYYALSLAIMGRTEQAVREADQAIALDPLSTLALNVAASTHFMLRSFDQSIALSLQAFALDAGFLPACWIRSLASAALGRHEDAVEAAARGVALTRRMPFFLAILGHALGHAGRKTEAQDVLSELIERSRQTYVPPMEIALVHEALGDVEAGIRALDSGLADWGGAYVLALAGPSYSALRQHPRYARILLELGYTGPWSADAAPQAPGAATTDRGAGTVPSRP